MSHQHFLDEIATKMDGVYKQLDEYKADFVTACNTTTNPVAAAFPSFSGRPANLEEQWKRLQDLYAVVDDLKALVCSTQDRIQSAEKSIDDLEQYGRSNCLIIHGAKDVPKEGKYLECENFVCDLINEKIKPETPLQVHDLDIAHPLPARKGTPVIIKFLRRTQRNYIYAKKKILKSSGLVITESLTKRRLKLLEAARSAFPWRSVWTMKGNVYVFHNNRRQVIHDFDDINKIKSKPAYARAVSG